MLNNYLKDNGFSANPNFSKLCFMMHYIITPAVLGQRISLEILSNHASMKNMLI